MSNVSQKCQVFSFLHDNCMMNCFQSVKTLVNDWVRVKTCVLLTFFTVKIFFRNCQRFLFMFTYVGMSYPVYETPRQKSTDGFNSDTMLMCITNHKIRRFCQCKNWMSQSRDCVDYHKKRHLYTQQWMNRSVDDDDDYLR